MDALISWLIGASQVVLELLVWERKLLGWNEMATLLSKPNVK